jgi:predicted secreted protein
MHNIKLKIGEEHSFTVDQFASGGYRWDYTIVQSGDVIEVKQESLTESPVSQQPDSIPKTFESKLKYTIKAVKPGIAHAKFFLHRAFDKNKPPMKEILIDVEVR